jgi:hypothetical protein
MLPGSLMPVLAYSFAGSRPMYSLLSLHPTIRLLGHDVLVE